MTDLDRLIEAVEAGNTCPSTKCLPKGCGEYVHRASKGSLDAAKALMDALLPERAAAELRYIRRYSDESYVYINMPSGGVYQGRSTKPARAWLLAVLKSYRSLQ